ncbi:MAG TPA: endopeptidase La [Gemmatimonadaceae bacterium]|nr:endopeptidase La [Gemmatimonadaceae bacterium]
MPLLFRDNEVFNVPERLPVLPLRDVVLFPYAVMPLVVGRNMSVAAVEAAATTEERCVLVVSQKDGEVQDPVATDLHRVGVVARLNQVVRLPNGTLRALVEGIGRVRITRYSTYKATLRGTIAPAPLTKELAAADAAELDARMRRTLDRFEEYVGLQRRVPPEVVTMAQGTGVAERVASIVASHVAVRTDLRQRLLESRSLGDMFDELTKQLSSEIDLLRLERKIDDDVRGSLFRNQREFYLQEQLRAIHRELGSEDGDDLDDLAQSIEQKGFPEPVLERARREVRRLRRMSPLAPEATVSRNYLDWLLALPWTERTEDVLDIAHARQVLEEDHYGLEEVKDRILDFIAVIRQVGKTEGPILCLVGPPGVGKTSLGRSIARAIGRKFVRMSLGGVRDEAEIRGHRRTYIGSLPGRIVQSMRRAGVINPVLLLDEVDKLGADYRGDPSAALLEVLDPEQNRAFNDHYLEVDYDLSHVLFITTANTLPAIPDALRDRMEIIRLSGYLDLEKFAIAQQFLIPKQLERHGVVSSSVVFENDVVPAIVRGYTREAGVRELERRIARIARKVARRRAERPVPAAEVPNAEAEPDRIRADELKELLGIAPYDPDDTSLDDRVGVASGLAYTSVGGEVLEVEVSIVPGRGRLVLTGTLGDVMKESATAALSYTRSRAGALNIPADFYKTRDVHVHIPTGATPKDGPSAGVAIAVALASALTGTPIRGDVAMTGEVTLRGRVLPIGGLKEKSVAALRSGIRHLIIPRQNERELGEFPEDVRNGLSFHPVRTMDEALGLALRQLPAESTGALPGSKSRGRRGTAPEVTHADVVQPLPEAPPPIPS